MTATAEGAPPAADSEGVPLIGPGAGATTDCPYPGLNFYTENDTKWFFGRDAERQTISANLRAGRLTLLHAESGVGKSSLLRAGVAAKLLEVADNRIAAGRVPQYLPIVFSAWKDEPSDTLTESIADLVRRYGAPGAADAVPRGELADTLNAAADATGATLLIVLDQFEEYFVYLPGERVPGRFATQLAECVNRPDVRANFLIAIRKDAHARLGELFAGRIPNVYGNDLNLDYLTRAEARESIEGPIRFYNEVNPEHPVELEDGLLDAVLDEVGMGWSNSSEDSTRPAGVDLISTPLLQLVMRALWDHEQGKSSRVLRRSSLAELDVASIVDAHVQKALKTLNRRERKAVTEVFDHLVTASGSKIAEPVADLAARTGFDELTVGTVLDKLDHARIVRPVPAPPGKDPERYRRFEIFHDVLSPAINRVIASNMAEKRLRRARRLISAALALLLVMLAATASFLVLWRNSVHERDVAQSTAMGSLAERDESVDPELATLLALKAEGISPTPQAYDALAGSLPAIQEVWTRQTADQDGADAIAFSPDGAHVVAGTVGGSLETLNAKTGSREHFFTANHGDVGINSVSYGKDGTIVLAASANGSVDIFTSNGKYVLWSRRPGTDAYDAVYNKDFTDFAVAERSKGNSFINVWSYSRTFIGQIPIPGTVVDGIALSPDGSEVAAAEQGGAIEVFSVATKQVVSSLPAPELDANTVAFSPDGLSLLGAYANNHVVVWNIASRSVEHEFTITGGSTDAAFTDDGNEVVATSDAGQAVVWNLSNGSEVSDLRSNFGKLGAAAFNPSGSLVATANNLGVLSVWRTHPYGAVGATLSLPPADASVYDVEVDNQTGDVYATMYSGVIVRWDPRTGLMRVIPGDDQAAATTFGPGRTLIAENEDNTITEWSLSDLRRIRLPASVASHIYEMAYLPDGHRYVIQRDTNTFYVGNYLNWKRDRRMQVQHPSGAFWATNKDGTELVESKGNKDGIHVYDTATGRSIENFTVHPGGLYPADIKTNVIDVSADGTRIAVGESNGDAYVYDARSGAEVGRVGVDDDYLNCLSFAPNTDNEILTGGADGTARIWDVSSNTQLEILPATDQTEIEQCGFDPATDEFITGTVGGTLQAEHMISSENALVGEATARIDQVTSRWVRQALLRTCECGS